MIHLKQIREAEDQAWTSRLSDAYLLNQEQRAEYLDYLKNEIEKRCVEYETYREG